MLFYEPNSPSLLENVLAKIESELDDFEAKAAAGKTDTTKRASDKEHAQPVR